MLLQSFEGGPAETIGYLVADDHAGPALAIDAPLAAPAATPAAAPAGDISIKIPGKN